MPGRDNGLVARSYLVLGDLDPRLVDTLLGALREAGIAAYALPSPGRVGGYLDVRLPEAPQDRLWVDANRFDDARALLRVHLRAQGATGADGGHPLADSDPRPAVDGGTAREVDPDRAFAALVAAFDEPVEAAPWPAVEDLPEEHDSRVPRRVLRQPLPPPSPPEVPTGEYDPLSVLDEHFVPPDPPPPPKLSKPSRWAIVLLAAGLLLIALNSFTDLLPSGTVTAGIAAIVGGVAILIHRMRAEPPEDPDDGAVV